MRIGELAKRAGISIQTVRFYEREGVLREPTRTPSGYRSYSDQDLETVNFIKQCQHLSFTLREIRQLIDLHNVFATLPHWNTTVKSSEAQEFLALAKERLSTIDEKLEMLQQMKIRLSTLVTNFQSSQILTCPAPSQNQSAKRKKVRSAKNP